MTNHSKKMEVGSCPHCGESLSDRQVRCRYLVDGQGKLELVDGQIRVILRSWPRNQQKAIPFLHGVFCTNCGGSLEKVVRNTVLVLESHPKPKDDNEDIGQIPFVPGR